MRENAAPLVRALMLCLCKTLGRAGLAARMLFVPSGREPRTGGDARIRGKEQAAGSSGSCRPLLRFVRLSSERARRPVGWASSLRRNRASSTAPAARSGGSDSSARAGACFSAHEWQRQALADRALFERWHALQRLSRGAAVMLAVVPIPRIAELQEGRSRWPGAPSKPRCGYVPGVCS